MWRELRVCCFENNSYTNCRQDPNIYDLACTQEAVAASIHQTEFVNRWSNGDNWRSWVHFLWVVLYLILESGVGRFISGIEGKQSFLKWFLEPNEHDVACSQNAVPSAIPHTDTINRWSRGIAVLKDIEFVVCFCRCQCFVRSELSIKFLCSNSTSSSRAPVYLKNMFFWAGTRDPSTEWFQQIHISLYLVSEMYFKTCCCHLNHIL